MTELIVGERFVLSSYPFGAGAFGEVFRVQDLQRPDDHDPVMKRLNDESAGHPFHFSRFRREIRTMASVEHVNVMPVIAYDLDDPLGPWLVSPFADGGNLADYITLHGPLSPDDSLKILRDVAAGVDYIHTRAILHRDLSPGNVLLLNGHWVISDFGLAHVSEQPVSFQTSYSVTGYGTTDFCSPEQKQSLASATALSDVYSLGKLFQYMQTGASPAHEPGSDLPLRFEIRKATATSPQDRYGSPALFVDGVVAAIHPAPRDPESVSDMAEQYAEDLSESSALPTSDTAAMLGWLVDLDIKKVGERDAFIDVMNQVTGNHFERLTKVDRERAMTALSRFEEAVLDADRGFNHADQPARVFAAAATGNTDATIRKIAVRALARIGGANNRWFCLDRLQEIFARPAADELVSAMVDGLKESGEVRWVFQDNSRLEQLPNPLRGRFRALLKG